MKYKVGDVIIWIPGASLSKTIAQITKIDNDTYIYKFILHYDNSIINTSYQHKTDLIDIRTRLLTEEDKLELL